VASDNTDEKDNESAKAKLKELERTLAKELDQQVKLAEPTDARLDGTVALNPTFDIGQIKPKKNESSPGTSVVTEKVGAATQTGDKKVEDISLQDVDDLLNQLDSTFQSSLADIKSEISKIDAPLNLESISISADYLKGDKDDASDDEDDELSASIVDALSEAEVEVDVDVESKSTPTGKSFFNVFMGFLRASLALPLILGRQLIKELLLMKTIPPKNVLLAIPGALSPFIYKWIEALREFIEKLRSYSLTAYLKFVVFLVLISAFCFLVSDIIVNTRSDEVKDPFLRSFSEVAQEIQLLPEDDSGEDLESPLKHPEYTVLLPRIMANLKPPSPRYSPMIVFELYLEASNQDCAIEIHDREVEIKDLIERIVEQITFEEIESAQGKLRLKVRLRAGLNRILNKGRVRRIFFKSLNIQK